MMIRLFLIMFVSLIIMKSASATHDLKVNHVGIEENQEEILYVIKLKKSFATVDQISTLKGMNSNDTKVIDDGIFIRIEYKGTQLISEVEPTFIKEVNVYKGDKAKSKYPNAAPGGVIEMIVENVDVFMSTVQSISTIKN